MKGREEQFPTVDLRTAAEERYLAYALSVITMRALPDVRDGLKPVQRRILYAMYQNLRLTAGTKPRKSAAVVGEVLGKYHPHGDVAAYDAMVRMAQDFALRYPLVHGEGNFGSLDGDNPAAMRYTEARLTALAEELLRDIRHDTVDFRENYDATLREPVVLPAAIPQLLINGSTGIAVGMATNIPPHNLREVGAALLALIDDADLSVKDLCKHVKGPDFPTGGEILNTRAELRAIYETGQGAVRVRGEYNRKLEKIGRKACIIVTSIPYTANKARIVEEIAEHIIARRLPQAVDVRDESTDTVRIVIEIKPDTPPEQVMAYLFKHTGLQINFNVNLTALVPSATGVGQPARLNLKELCRHFLDFRLTIVTRRLEHELRELQARLHILAGFIKLFAGLDRAIKIIRESGSRPDAQKALMKAFDLDEIQTDAILETRLYQLARLEIEKIRQEQREKKERAAEIERLLKSTKARWKLVAAELTEVVEKYGDARRTVLSAGAELVYDAEAYVVHEDATVVVTRDGWMKRVGEIKDPSSTRVREGDIAKWILRGNTRDQVVLISNFGVAYVMKVVSVPATTGYGEPVQSLLNLKDGERIIHAVLTPSQSDVADAPPGPATPVPAQKELFAARTKTAEAPASSAPRWLMASAGGMGFFCRPDLSETTRSGRRIARIKDGDEIVVASLAEGDILTAATKDGHVLSFPADELPELAGAGRGVILMRLDKDDRLVSAVCHPKGTSPVAIDDEGGEHRFNLPEPAHRAQKGRKAIKRFKLAELTLRER